MKSFVSMVAIFVLLSLFVVSVSAFNVSFVVPALESVSRDFFIEDGEYITGSFSVSGATNPDHNKVVFKINDPSGVEIYDARIEGSSYDGVASASFTFTPNQTGTYTMIFDNTRLRFAENITITIDYQIKQKILQTTQETFLLVLTITLATILTITLMILRKRK